MTDGLAVYGEDPGDFIADGGIFWISCRDATGITLTPKSSSAVILDHRSYLILSDLSCIQLIFLPAEMARRACSSG